MPTTVNNVETIAVIPSILKKGHDWFTTTWVQKIIVVQKSLHIWSS